MYECPNCAGNLKFDISRQQLYCEYCHTQLDPYCVSREKDAQETDSPSGEYEVTVFTCPQCGGQIISEDTTAATFCSFCGGSVILDSRISRERRPVKIIPFTKTKEDCRAAYGRMLRRAVFAPKALKDEALIGKFRGIYMPYWVYSLEKKGEISFTGKATGRSGDYQTTDHYQLSCEVEENYQGLAFDASSTFSDSLSNAIGPFDLRKGKEFAPSFLCGFYGDTSDVGKEVYHSDAEEFVIQDAGCILAKDPVCKKYHAGQEEDRNAFRNALRPSDSTAELAMLPVWFLAYQNGSRVSYAVVNGQTGKAAADLPVDGKRYLAGSFLLAIPLFFLLNLKLTLTPGKILLIAALLAFLCILISNGQLNRMIARDLGEDDKGLESVRALGSGRGKDDIGGKRKKEPWKPWEDDRVKVILMVVSVTILMMVFWNGIEVISAFSINWIEALNAKGLNLVKVLDLGLHFLPLLIVTISFVFSALKERFGRKNFQENQEKSFWGGHFERKWTILIKPFGGIVLAAVIWALHPVSDEYYYIGAFVCIGTVLWNILEIIKQHNMLATRKLPQLGIRGGDEDGKG